MKDLTRRSFTGALVGLAATPLLAQSLGRRSTDATPGVIAEQCRGILSHSFPDNGPGAAGIVMVGDQVRFEGGSGLAVLRQREMISPATVFRYGSITKQFTAATILKLVEQGDIKLDDPLSQYVSTPWKDVAGITIERMLNHTSGLPDRDMQSTMTPAQKARPHTLSQLMRINFDQPMSSVPGTVFKYNNYGYLLLSAVIESVTKTPWYEVVRSKVTGPLGLQTLRYGVAEKTMPKMARGYQAGRKGYVLAQPFSMTIPCGAGALIGTAGDLARWTHALHNGEVLSPSSYKLMTTPGTLSDGHRTSYGFGLFIGQAYGQTVIHHDGDIEGFNSNVAYLVESKIIAAVLENQRKGPLPATHAVRQFLAIATEAG